MNRTSSPLIVIVLISAAIALVAFKPGDKKYFCLPCGQACDKTVHEGPGMCPACKMALVEESTLKFKNIDFNELCNRIKANKDVVLLDVRSKEEFNNSTPEHGPAFGRFKNAININIYELEGRVSELDKYKDKEVIVYCSHSHRSPQASYYLANHGFKNVKNVSGGVSVLIEDKTPECLKGVFVKF